MFDIASPKRQHLPQHDLESFFYVIVIITMLFTKPGEKRGPEHWKRAGLSESLGTWWNAKEWNASAQWKFNTMRISELEWSTKIARHIRNGYFDCWMPHICELRKAIFGGMDVRSDDQKESLTFVFSNSSPIGYDKMISVLEAMVKVGEEVDREEDHSQPSSPRNDYGSEQGEWKEYFALESSDGSQTCGSGITEYVFTKVETFKIMNAIERSVVQLPDNVGAANSDVPADQYPADPYLGNLPSVGNIPKFDNSSIRTSDLPTASRSTLSQSDMPSPSVMLTSSDQTHSTKRMGPAQPGDEPERKKSHQNQPSSSSSVKPSRKDQVSSTSKSASLKKPSRTSGKNHQPAQRASAGTSNVASTRASSSKQRRRKCGDDEKYIPSAAKEKRGNAAASDAVKNMKALSLRPAQCGIDSVTQ
jgi:hypothetical protein